MTTRFGELCRRAGVRSEAKWERSEERGTGGAGDLWRVELRLERRRLQEPFWRGPGLPRSPPETATVLHALFSDAWYGEQYDVREFARELGYPDPDDPDDPGAGRAARDHARCVAMGPRLRHFLGSHYDDFSAAFAKG